MTIETTAPAEPAEKSLREELQASYAAATADDVVETPAEGGGTGSAPAEPRARDQQGRFAGKTDAVDATIVDPAQRAGATGTVGNAAPTDGTQQAAAPAAPATARPGNLKPELHAAWEAADPALRKHFADREAEIHKGFTRMDEERQYGRQMRDVISPYMPLIQAQGSDPAKAVQSLLNTAYIFTAGTPQQKVAALHQVAQQYQIPLEQLQQFAQQPQQRVDPQVADLQRQVQQLTQSRQQDVAAREQAEQHELQTAITTFAAAPGHDHFEQVKPHMAALLTNGLAKDLQDAYEQAIWARPDLRQTVLAAQQQTAQATTQAQTQQRTAAARKAAASVAGSPGTSVPVAPPDRSLRDEIRANLRAAQV